jgi:hypothetical protein
MRDGEEGDTEVVVKRTMVSCRRSAQCGKVVPYWRKTKQYACVTGPSLLGGISNNTLLESEHSWVLLLGPLFNWLGRNEPSSLTWVILT